MRLLTILTLSIALLGLCPAMDMPSFHTKGSPTGTASGDLKPGEYWWHPELSPVGPVTVLVSIPHQVMHVYRNGILIGRSTVSTGSNGHATPAGVFSILEKQQSHRSSKYDDAPMPNMQRITWGGIAMHSGNLPGYAASHGCVRLPYDFSQLLFRVTATGGMVVIGDGKSATPYLASNPGLMLAPKDFTPTMLRPLGGNDYDWQPQRSTGGPITILISSADRAMYVYRNGNPIGRAAVDISGGGLFGTRKGLGENVFTMLEGTTGKPSRWVPGREGRRWIRVSGSGPRTDVDDVAKRLHFNPAFAAQLYEAIAPGTTVVVTDQPAVRKPVANGTIFEH